MIVYQFGIGKKISDRLPESVYRQFRLQNDFWNALVETEFVFQERYNELVSGSSQALQATEDEIAKATLEISELRASIKKQRQKSRKAINDRFLKKQVAEKKEELKVLRQDRKDLRAETKEVIKPKTKALDKERLAVVKSLRQEFAGRGLYWGNYNAVADSYKRSRQLIFKKRKKGLPAQMRFHRFIGEGRLTVQFQGGISVQSLFSGQSGLLQIDPVPEAAWAHPVRGERKRLRKTTGRIRVCSDGAAPVWFEFPLTLHRRIPDAGRIKFAQLRREKIGTGWRWRLNITVDEPEAAGLELPEETIALDIGWRKLDDGLRVAAWGDSTGLSGEVVLNTSYLKVNARLLGLQSLIDSKFNEAKSVLRGIFAQESTVVPEWMQQECANLQQWLSPLRMVNFVEKWEDNRFSGDKLMLSKMLAWKEQHIHLYDWLCNLRDKMQSRRKEEYRIFAKQVSSEYSCVLLEEFDLSNTARLKQAEDGVDWRNAARHWAKVASPGLLRLEIERACAASGAEVVRVDAKYTTVTCFHCKNRMDIDPSRQIMIECDHCGLVFDQDHGAVHNILERGSRTDEPQAVTAAG